MARAVDKLDAELEAAEVRFASAKDKVDAAFDNGDKRHGARDRKI